MQIGDLSIRPFYETAAPAERDNRGWLQLRGEVPWLVEGPESGLLQIQEAVGSVARRLGSSLLQLDFGNSVGELSIPLLGRVSVLTAKWTERDFDQMLADLTAVAGGLPYTAGSVTSLPYDRSLVAREDVLYHAFTYLRHILTTEDPNDQLMPQLRVILADPYRRMEEYRKNVPIAVVRTVTPRSLDSVLASAGNLCSVGQHICEAVPLARALKGSLPEFIEETQHRMSFDTAENRFVKLFLGMAFGIADKMQEVSSHSKSAFAPKISDDCEFIKRMLRPVQQHSLWKDVGEMVHFPASSTILQRRRGYKEVFRHFSKLRLATRVPVPEAIVQYLLETKDIALLYELWCFFTVCNALEGLIGRPKTSSTVSVKKTEMAVEWEFKVDWVNGVKAYYNPSFSRSKPLARKTYSVPLRPDIAIETPGGDLHLLDAKFKLDRLDSVMNESDDSAEVEERRGTFKRADLYKMHTYRDAIPRAKTVWILYPGTEYRFFGVDGTVSDSPDAYPDLNEGVGGIPLVPTSSKHSLLSRSLSAFLGDLVK